MTGVSRWPLWVALLTLAVILSLANMHAQLPFGSWPALPLSPQGMSVDQIILAYAVWPRGAVAFLAGAALGLSGALLQAVLRNPIADPSTLGISAGAQLFIVAATLFAPSFLDGHRALVAFAGAGGAALLVFALGARQAFEPVTMVVAGMLIGMTAASLSAALTLSQGEYLMSLATWNGGSLSQQDWSVAGTMFMQLAVLALATLPLIRPLAALEIGDVGAQALGVPLALVRFAVALVAVCLTASVAAGVGLVGFVGLAAPAMVRASGVRRIGRVVLASPFAGGLLLFLCDGIVQWVASASGETFPTGSIMALVGAPLLLFLLSRIKNATPPGRGAPMARRAPRMLYVLAALLLAAALISLMLAPSKDGGLALLSPGAFLDFLPLRWPRLVSAASAGALLAMAGTCLQRLTGNPLASPEVLGVSGGAGTGYALALTIVPAATATDLLAGATLGAVMVLVLVLAFATRAHLPPARLLLAGISISALGSAILSALIAVGDQRAWQILAWIGGSASSATPTTALILLALMAAVLLVALACARWLTILPLGQSMPQALGLPLRRARLCLIAIAALATGAASLLVGPLSFVGLVAPHIVARAGVTRSGEALVAACLIGAGLMAAADIGARLVAFPYELPLGLFAALLGGPYLVWLLGRRP